MDDKCGKSIPGNEVVYHRAPNANRTKAKKRVDHVPLRGQRSNQRSLVNGKGLATNANLLCQPCSISSENQLQLNGKIGTSSSTRLKEAKKILPSIHNNSHYRPANQAHLIAA
ncbi:hypothetical protein Tco_0170936 [Tanacetum coccineum]